MEVPEISMAQAPSERADSLESFDPDVEFRDDLIAANRFKSFLVSSGADVPERVINGLAELTAQYLYDVGGEDLTLQGRPSFSIGRD